MENTTIINDTKTEEIEEEKKEKEKIKKLLDRIEKSFSVFLGKVPHYSLDLNDNLIVKDGDSALKELKKKLE